MRRTAQHYYSHVQNSTHEKLDQIGLTTLGATINSEPHGTTDMGANSSKDEPPSW